MKGSQIISANDLRMKKNDLLPASFRKSNTPTLHGISSTKDLISLQILRPRNRMCFDPCRCGANDSYGIGKKILSDVFVAVSIVDHSQIGVVPNGQT